jgi:hypothetical protein
MTNTALKPAVPTITSQRLGDTFIFQNQTVEVRIARSRSEVEEIREIWSVRPSHRDSDIDFCLDVVWKREEVIRPHVILIYRDGQPETMFVGRVEDARMKAKSGYMRLPGIPSRRLVFSYGGLLGSATAENCRQIMASITATLRNGEADVAVLANLRVSSVLFATALRASGFATRDHIVKPTTRYTMKLPADIKNVYLGLSQNHRSDLKRKARKLLADHHDDVKVRCFREPAEVEELIRQAEDIAKRTYQRGLGVGFHDNEEIRRKLRLCAEKGWLRAYVLYLANTPCAFWIGTLYHGSFCSDYLAFDPLFRANSPGTFLLMKVVEEFCNAGVKEIDFGSGESRYKEQFGNTPLTEASVLVFAPTVKGVLLNAMRTSTGSLENLVRKVLERTELLPKLKRFWRLRVTKQ